jgi:hypothetical protein
VAGRHRGGPDAHPHARRDLLEHLLDVLVLRAPHRLRAVRPRVDRPPVHPRPRRPAGPHERLVAELEDRRLGPPRQAVARGQPGVAPFLGDLLDMEPGGGVGQPQERHVAAPVAQPVGLPAPREHPRLDAGAGMPGEEARLRAGPELAGARGGEPEAQRPRLAAPRGARPVQRGGGGAQHLAGVLEQHRARRGQRDGPARAVQQPGPELGSRRATDSERAGWDRCRASAARAKDSASATATK